MPKIRTLSNVSATPTLTTLHDPLPAPSGVDVLVTTDETTGDPVAVARNGVEYALNATHDTTRVWLATEDGRQRQINTFDSYPNITGNAAN